SGTGTLYFVLTSGQANVNWLEFDGRGVTDNERPTIDSFEVTPTTGTAPLTVTASVAATDPEDDAITFAWDAGLGDGFVDGGDTFEVTYDEPGTYRLQVRATDERGAYSTEYTTVTVKAPETGPGMCFSGRSDDFLGSDVDEDRWTVTNRDQNLVVRDGRRVHGHGEGRHARPPAVPAGRPAELGRPGHLREDGSPGPLGLGGRLDAHLPVHPGGERPAERGQPVQRGQPRR